MKKMNLLAMSLVSAAALSFSSCSNNDDLGGGAGTQSQVDGFYMTLAIKTPKADGTRTSQTDRTNVPATPAEAAVTNGTFYLYEGKSLIYKKVVEASDWQTEASTNNNKGITKPIKIAVNGVKTGIKYKVYFLAGNQTSEDPINDVLPGTYTKGTSNLATANSFVMFNQNDAQRQDGGAEATIEFTADNNTSANPAKCQNIYLDRVVARIDAPVKAADFTKFSEATATKKPVTTNLNLVKSISYQNYAISNLSQKVNVMQKWESEFTKFLIAKDVTYAQDYATFGGKYNNNGSTSLFDKADNHYVLENTTADVEKATSMYICYKADLDLTGADFTDGTFYRYDNKIYTSLQQIFNDKTVAWPFVNSDNATNMTVADALALIQNEDKSLKDQATLATVREKYGIDIYEQGNMFYRVPLMDEVYSPETAPYSILRNSIYKLTVTGIYDLGKDVPNGPDGPDDKNKNYFMQCTVTVNNWVVSNQSIDLK